MKHTNTAPRLRAAFSLRRSRGFTLIETLIVLAIILSIAGFLGVPMYQRAQQNSQIASAARAIASAKSALAMYTNLADFNGLVPITEGTGIPLTGTMAGATNTVIGNATTLQTALLTARCLEAPIAANFGANTPPTGATTAPAM